MMEDGWDDALLLLPLPFIGLRYSESSPHSEGVMGKWWLVVAVEAELYALSLLRTEPAEAKDVSMRTLPVLAICLESSLSLLEEEGRLGWGALRPKKLLMLSVELVAEDGPERDSAVLGRELLREAGAESELLGPAPVGEMGLNLEGSLWWRRAGAESLRLWTGRS